MLLPQWGKSAGPPEEIHFLQGPERRGVELRHLLGILSEFIHGFRTLHFVGPCVTVFGSARFPDGHPYYTLAREVGARLAAAGFTVMTGGGPGTATTSKTTDAISASVITLLMMMPSA